MGSNGVLWCSLIQGYFIFKLLYLMMMEPPRGLEPRTAWLQIRCSTNWAKAAHIQSKNNNLSSQLSPNWASGVFQATAAFGFCQAHIRDILILWSHSASDCTDFEVDEHPLTSCQVRSIQWWRIEFVILVMFKYPLPKNYETQNKTSNLYDLHSPITTSIYSVYQNSK